MSEGYLRKSFLWAVTKAGWVSKKNIIDIPSLLPQIDDKYPDVLKSHAVPMESWEIYAKMESGNYLKLSLVPSIYPFPYSHYEQQKDIQTLHNYINENSPDGLTDQGAQAIQRGDKPWSTYITNECEVVSPAIISVKYDKAQTLYAKHNKGDNFNSEAYADGILNVDHPISAWVPLEEKIGFLVQYDGRWAETISFDDGQKESAPEEVIGEGLAIEGLGTFVSYRPDTNEFETLSFSQAHHQFGSDGIRGVSVNYDGNVTKQHFARSERTFMSRAKRLMGLDQS